MSEVAAAVPSFTFSHMGLYVIDAARMEDFYTRVMGFAVTDRGDLGSTKIVFLSRDPREHHQIILASGRPPASGFNPINQISFRMADFAGLREMHRRLEQEGVRSFRPFRTAMRFRCTSATPRATASSSSSTRRGTCSSRCASRWT